MSGYIKLPSAMPPAPAPAPAAGGGGLTVNKNLLMVGGLVVVAVIALVNSRKGATDKTGTAADYNIDTTSTDVYNDLQPELEQIGDQLARLNNPAPVVPPVVPPRNPGIPKPAPKPQTPQRNYVRYGVKTGDTITKIAAAYHTTAANIYTWNRPAIDAAAKAHGRKSYGTATVLWPGTTLTIYINQPGQRGVKLGF